MNRLNTLLRSCTDHLQSVAAREAALTVNGDGFGLCWYGYNKAPGQYREIMPAWSDTNLANVCRMIHSDLFMAHIRASTKAKPHGLIATHSYLVNDHTCTTDKSLRRT